MDNHYGWFHHLDITFRDIFNNTEYKTLEGELNLQLKPGETITVINNDLVGHTLTNDSGLFDTGLISNKNKVTFTAPENPGEYPFHCTPHPFMKGALTVQ